MTFELGQVCHGFRLERREAVTEIETDAMVFRHEKTGAELVVLQSSDDNKVFMITFKTPPDDDTGVAHILEHSVLNGSVKYQVKEPFAELLKASLYTFLNAMTYPDKTVYPVASRNAQDFTNLMDVYLDAVFAPLLSRHTFMQEGWHHELGAPGESADDVDDDDDDMDGAADDDEEDGEGDDRECVECESCEDDTAEVGEPVLSFSGVVYNEMLGASSDPEGALSDELDKALFPASTYGRNSGGDPEAIPTLTYEQFVDFHKRFYHPSNSRIVLAGDLDIPEKLEHLARYLDTFEYQEIDATIIAQPRFAAPVTHAGSYPIDSGEDTAAKTYVLRGWLMDTPVDPEYAMAASMLSHIISGTPAAPLRKALVDAHLGEDVLNWGFQGESEQTWYAIGLRGAEPSRVAAFEQLVDDTLRKLVADGIDPRSIEASMNSIEFRLREANYGGYPKGLVHALGMMQGWLYGGDPIAHLRYEAPLAAIKERVAAGGYFESMISQWLINNPHRVTVIMEPDTTHETRRLARLKTRLAGELAAMSAARRESIVAESVELKAAQLRPDAPEALAKLPKLPLSCVPRLAEVYPFELLRDTANEPRLSFSEQPTQGIAYLKLAFDATMLPTHLLPYLPIFGKITMQGGTKQRDYVELMQEIGIHTGGIGSGYHCTNMLSNPHWIVSSFGYNGKVLVHRLPKLIDLLTEIITQADLSNVTRIKELIRSSRATAQARFIPAGSGYATTRLAAYTSRVGMYAELTGGLSQVDFLGTLVTAMDVEPETVLDNLKRVRELVLRRQNLHIHLTGSATELAMLQGHLPRLLDALPNTYAAPLTEMLPHLDGGEALVVPAKIQYVGKGANFRAWGYEYTGAFEVLNKLLNRDYLWNKVRVQGNAYGCFSSYDFLDGDYNICSYRDPNLAETLKTFDSIGNYLETLNLGRDEFEKLQIATMGSNDSPRTADVKGAVAFNRWETGITQEFVQRRREQILDATPQDLKAHAELFKRFASEGQVCVVGGEVAINACRPLFRSVRNVFGKNG